jgi:trans-aconitate methyltransferase
MAKYHKYVFDLENKKFIGDFETMYQNESKENFDSWHQEDSRQLQRKIALAILEDFNFSKILDIGCGKGALTHLLKKRNNKVFGIDISHTAISIAKERFSDIDFEVLDVSNTNSIISFYNTMGGVNLTFTSEVFSYIYNWKEVLKVISVFSEYFMISLYIPDNPIGYVKSEIELVYEISLYFNIVEHIFLNKNKSIIILGKRKNDV